jgi:predicted DNA-binding transcriptional regulator AlpA
MTEDELVDAAEGERITGLKPSTLYKLVREGRLRSFKVLHARRFAKADLLALVKEENATARRSVEGRDK